MRFIPVSLCVLFVSSSTCATETPNIILCMADDQGWGDVGYNGHPVIQTPVLDKMAASGLRFDRAYAAHPVCSPTRGSVMTGRNPNRFACFSWGHTLRPQEITVAEALKNAGYATGHFGKWHLGSCRAEDEVSPGNSGFDVWVSSPNFYNNDPLLSKNGHVIQTHGESSAVTMDGALKFINKQATSGQPFLAVIWFGNPHRPHEATDELKALYPDQSKAKANYYGEVTGIDQAMGRLLESLDDLDIEENTLLWYTSDNGAQGRTPGSTGGLRGAKGQVWEGGIRVPGILIWPDRIRQPRVSDVPVVTSDIYPTVLDIAGVSLKNQPPLDGVSLVPLINGKMTKREKPIGVWNYPIRGISTPSQKLLAQLQAEQAGKRPPTKPPQRTAASRMERTFSQEKLPGRAAWIDGDWKLHRFPKKKGEAHYELYNLAQDRAETTDVAEKHPERSKKMQAALHKWQQSVIASLNGDDY